MQEQNKAGLPPAHHDFADETLFKHCVMIAGIVLLAMLAILATTQPVRAWSGTGTHRWPIYQLGNLTPVFSVNNIALVNGVPTWTRSDNDSYLYCGNVGCTAGVYIANDTNAACYEIEGGSQNCISTLYQNYFADYHFNETSALDATGNGHSCTYAGTANQLTSAVYGKALEFDATTTDTCVDLDIPLGSSFSISFWLNATGVNVDNQHYFYSQPYGFYLSTGNADHSFYWGIRNVGWPTLASGLFPTANQWDYYVMIHDCTAGQLYFYKNGAVLNAPVAAACPRVNWGVDNHIGQNVRGAMDEMKVRIYAMSVNEMLSEYNNGLTNHNYTAYGTMETASWMDITINTPTATTYWRNSLNLNFTAQGTNAIFDAKAWLNGNLIYSNAAYANASTTTVNITTNITHAGAYNLTVKADGTADDTIEVDFDVADWQVLSTYSNVFVPETNDSIFINTAHYNQDFITGAAATLNWNSTDQPQTAQTQNTTHIISFVNYTIPLIWANNTEIDFFISNLITAANASTPRLNGSAIKQNITYVAWLDSVATDSANYLEGEGITGYLYAKVNGSRPTLRAQLDLRYNDTRNITQEIASYTGTATRTYEYIFPFHAPTANSENITLNGTFDVSYGGRTRSKNTTVNATVAKMFINNCSEGAPTIMLDFRNETDFGLATGYIPLIYFNLTSGIISRQYSFANLTENRTFTFCLNPSWSNPTADIFFRYLSASAPERQYYLNQVHLTSTKETVYPFLLNSTFAYYANIFVYNQYSARIANAYVRVLKMNPATAAYETMFIGRTDSEGVMPTFLYPLTQPYKFFILDSNNSVLYMTSAENIPCVSGSCPPYEKHIYTTASLVGYISFEGITHTATWDNSTRTLTLNVLDASGISQSIWLRIWALNEFGGRSLYYQSISNTSTLSYSAVLPNTTSQYQLSVMVEENDNYYPYIDETLNVYQIERFGVLGIIIGAFIVCACIVSGYYAADLIGGIIGGYLGLWLCSGYGLQLIPIDATGLAAIGIVLAIIGYAAIK